MTTLKTLKDFIQNALSLLRKLKRKSDPIPTVSAPDPRVRPETDGK